MGLDALRAADPEAVGQYQLLARLGSGGMGVVYLARSPGGRRAAVKVVRPEHAEHPEFRSRFRREVAAARAVDSPYAVAVLAADTEADLPWLATGYVLGPSLAEAVAEHGPLPVGSVRALGAGLAEALAAIHAAGLIHRDLKPSNVLLAPDGPRVIDFGISLAVDGMALTQVGMLVGTPGFMCPEQAAGRRTGPPGDLFSLGSVLVYAATGAGPYSEDGGTLAMIHRVANERPDLGRLPEGLTTIVRALLAKNPELRPTTRDLVEILAPEGTSEAFAGDWLPGRVSAALARHAGRVVELETPLREPSPDPTPTPPAQPPVPTPVPTPVQAAEPVPGRAPVRLSRRALFAAGGVAALAVGGSALALARPRLRRAAPPPQDFGGPTPDVLWRYHSRTGQLAVAYAALDKLTICAVGNALVAVDVVGGAELWSQYGVQADAVVVHNRTAFVLGGSALRAYSTGDGTPNWAFTGWDSSGGRLVPEALLCADDRAVYAGGRIPGTGTGTAREYGWFAVSIATQQQLWLDSELRPDRAFDFVGRSQSGALLFADNLGYLDFVDPKDGSHLWSDYTKNDRVGWVVADTDQLYLPLGEQGLQALRSFDGAQQWEHRDPMDQAGPYTPVAVAAGILYTSPSRPEVRALSAQDGTHLWSCALPGPPTGVTPLLVNDTLFVPGWDAHLYAVDIQQRRIRWTFRSTPLTGADWQLSTDGERLFAQYGTDLYALPPE
ncbi:protein kinase [Kitasatospora sp. MAP5-34]|uniref:serine/threonine-protein kinase n=1 Tax=Kitasatospora sp. MAP5-34 TaxID=3035102 RepID=UPI002474C075|nr:protein kinase [Kitasatospora sp. MAP5-34]MDH6577902.1 outer membrane protein assembly factor BamB [Kitasatospora sp. MAP5-34]